VLEAFFSHAFLTVHPLAIGIPQEINSILTIIVLGKQLEKGRENYYDEASFSQLS